MTDEWLVSLISAIEPWFGKPLAELPPALKSLVNTSWDKQDEKQRRAAFAAYCEDRNVPVSASDLEMTTAFKNKLSITRQKYTKWASVATPTASDLEKQEDKLAKHGRELADLENEWNRGDYLEEVQFQTSGSSQIGPKAPPRPQNAKIQNEWHEYKLRRLLDEASEPDMTHAKLAEKYGVSRQLIGRKIAYAATQFRKVKHADIYDPLKKAKKKK
jgi:hypothetical protein